MLSRHQMLSALDGLIAEGQALYQNFLKDLQPFTADFAAWMKAAESTIEAIFGTDSDTYRSFRGIHYVPPLGEQHADPSGEGMACLGWFESGLRFAHASLVGYRYSVERLAADPRRPNPNIFISHGGPRMDHVNGIKDFLGALGLQGVVVQDMPSLNLSLNEKVRLYLSMCAAGIALATRDDEVEAETVRTRPNVEIEIGMMQTAPNIASRIIYLKEPDVQFASNYAEKVWIAFEAGRIQDALIAIARELRAFGFLGP